MSDDQQAEIERLRTENERLKKATHAKLATKVSEKGALSVYGMGRFPVTPTQGAMAEASRHGGGYQGLHRGQQ